MNAYAVIIEAHTDRSLTDEQMNMLTVTLRDSSASVAHATTSRYLRFTLRVDVESMGEAVTEAIRVTSRAACIAGFSCEAEELRVLPFARLEEETMRLLSADEEFASDLADAMTGERLRERMTAEGLPIPVKLRDPAEATALMREGMRTHGVPEEEIEGIIAGVQSR